MWRSAGGLRVGATARYAHIPDSALVAAADRVSARIASALDGRVTADGVSLHHQAEALTAG
jgi:hypothetical protein